MTITTLSLSVRPHAGESLSSLLFRIANQNGVEGIQPILRAAGITRGYRPRGPKQEMALSLVCRMPPKLITAISPVECATPDKFGKKQLSFFGHRVQADHLLIGDRDRVCPTCLAASRYRNGLHNFNFVTCCAWDGSHLLDICPSCGSDIDAHRANIDHCKCGLDFRTVRPTQAAVEEKLIAQLICRRWLFTFYRGTIPDVPNAIDALKAMDLGEALRAIHFFYRFGRQDFSAGDPGVRSKSLVDVRPHIIRVGKLLLDWPEPFRDWITTSRGFVPRHSTALREAQSIERISFRMYTELPEPVFAFIHEELMVYLRSRIEK